MRFALFFFFLVVFFLDFLEGFGFVDLLCWPQDEVHLHGTIGVLCVEVVPRGVSQRKREMGRFRFSVIVFCQKDFTACRLVNLDRGCDIIVDNASCTLIQNMGRDQPSVVPHIRSSYNRLLCHGCSIT